MPKISARFPIVLILVLMVSIFMACSQDRGAADAALDLDQTQDTDKPFRVCVTTYVYKTVGDLKIKADVHQVDDGLTNPVVVWLHGGALITGGREGVPAWLKEGALAGGYDVISLDYRLAPETKLHEIIRDLEDAFRWIHAQGPGMLDIDTSRMVVAGASAGGYLALVAGYRVDPAPTALLSLWGYGDLIGPWQSEPSTHPRHNQTQMTAEQAEEIMSLPPIANARSRKGNGWAFYQYCRQNGLWPNLVSDFDMATEPEKFFPFMPLKNVTGDYPPTLLVHGTEDSDVPHEQSVLMQEEFVKHGVVHELLSIEGAEHSLWRAKPEDTQRVQKTVLEFISMHMKK
ncbi:MAG: alpha/beta hydrolase [Candidatus Aminicenantaceae bacterium]